MAAVRGPCRSALLASLLAVALPCPAMEPAPRNVILMIGDGMGFAQVTLARLSRPAGAPALALDSLACAGLTLTSSLDSVVTDSAAAATALASGHKTANGRISVLPDGQRVRTLLEEAERHDMATGLVTTTTITHATPAAFGAHVPDRDDEEAIAPQYLQAGVDVLIGGGREFFLPRSRHGRRDDERDLLEEARRRGYVVIQDGADLAAAPGPRLLALLQMDALTTRPPEPSLAEMASKALEVLAADPDGFFVMIEGGQIDWRAHDNDPAGMVEQIRGFDAAVAKALAFARGRRDTLVVVTADHETGGLSILAGPKGSAEGFHAAWTTRGHSGVDVPVFAEGPGASRFSGVLEDVEVARRLGALLRFEQLGAASPSPR